MFTDPRIRVRLGCPEDSAGVAAMARALSPRSIRMRFMGGVSREFAIDELRREIVAGRTQGEAFVAEDADGAIVGEAYAAYVNPGEAEAAFVVSDAWQNHGVGTALRAALFDRLRSEGIKTVYLETLPENTALLRLERDAGLPTKERFADGALTIQVDLPAAERIHRHFTFGRQTEAMTEVRVERYVNCPFSIAETYVADYLARATKGGAEATLELPSIAGRLTLSRSVELSFDRELDLKEPGRPHFESVVLWQSGSKLLPDFSGAIRTRIAVPGTLLIIAGRYWPPLGVCGMLFDSLIGRRIAHATLRTLAEKLGTALERRETRWLEDFNSAN